MSPFIDDGYTISDTLPAFPGFYDATPFKYRPALFLERSKFQVAAPDDQGRVAAEIIAEHVVEFPGLPEQKAARVAKLRRLYPTALNYLLNAVLNYTSPRANGESEAEADQKN